MGARDRASSVAASVAIIAVAAGLVVSGLTNRGATSIQVDLGPGTAWFASPVTGQVSMIDGPTATRVVILDAAAEGQDMTMVQAGDDGYAVDRTDGTMRHVDSATFVVGPKIPIAAPGDPTMQVTANDHALWVVAQNGTVVQQFDPVHGTTVGGPLPFPGTAASTAITADGTLWITDTASGLVRSYRNNSIHSNHVLDVSPASKIVTVDDIPVVVDTASDQLAVLDPVDGTVRRHSCLDLPPAATSVITGSADSTPWVLAALPANGTLQIVDLHANSCRPITLGAPEPATSADDRYGTPTSRNDRIFVPDRVTGSVIVVQPDVSPVAGAPSTTTASSLVRRTGATTTDPVITTIPLGLAGHDFRLFTHHAFVWFDDSTSDTAGVIRDDLTALIVDKTTGDGKPTPPPDPARNTNTPDTATLACRAAPAIAQPGQAVILTAIVAPARAQAANWAWSMPNGAPVNGVGPQTTASWAASGPHTVTVTASVALDGVATPLTGTCTVDIGTLPAPSSTVAPPPDSTPPATPPPTPPPTTAPANVTDVATSTPAPPPPSSRPPVSIPTTTPVTTTTSTSAPPPSPPDTPPATPPPTSATTSGPPSTPLATTIPAQPPATEFTWLPLSPKTGDAVIFTDTSTGAHDSTTWTFEGGAPPSSTATNPTVTWATPGTFSVTFTASNAGSAATVQHSITVVANTVVTPSVASLDVDAANAAIVSAGLTPGTPSTVHRLSPAGTVVATDPPIGTTVAPGTTVNLAVSDGLGEISTASGTGPTHTGFSGDGGPASAAVLNRPTQVLVDPLGNVYIADNFNNRIRKITTDGVINTIAGNADGVAGFSGDNGPATSARLARPRAMALDAAGNLYFADLDNHRVRKVDTAGIITTVAGGGATSCFTIPGHVCSSTAVDIGRPSGLAINPVDGQLYIASRDYCSVFRVQNDTVMFISVGTGVCGPTLEGAQSDTTPLTDVAGIAMSTAGLYIAEPGANKIQVVRADGTIRTLIGTGVGGFNGDGLAATATQLHNPDSVAVQGSRLVFTDWSNNRVRELLPDNTVRTVAGDGTGGYTGDAGAAPSSRLNLSGSGESADVTIATDGSLYIADPANNAIRHII